MEKITICYINVMDNYSGGEIVLQRLIRGLDKNLFDTIVYTKNTKFVDTLNCKECKVIVFDTQYQMKLKRGFMALIQAIKNFIVSAKYMYELKYKYKVDIAHSNSLTSNIYFAIWAKIFNIKFIAHSHEIRDGLVYNILHRYIGFCSHKIITVSNTVKDNWMSHGVNKEKIVTVYNGLNSDFF